MKWIIILLLILSSINVVSADGWNVTWTTVKESIIEKEYIISIQNLEDTNRDVNLSALFAETNFYINDIHDVKLFERGKTDWVESKPIDRILAGETLKTNQININIPKLGSDDVDEGIINGTKFFLLKFKTPILKTVSGYGSSGKVAITLDDVEYHPYWDSTYLYRKEIIITGETGAGTNYQVNFSIGDSAGGDFHLEGHSTNFPEDIRVVDGGATGELDYWIEDLTADPVNIWVNVSDDLGSNQSIWIYYGKSGATTDSDGSATFEFFDDFEDAVAGDWTTDDAPVDYASTNDHFSGVQCMEVGASANTGRSHIDYLHSENIAICGRFKPTNAAQWLALWHGDGTGYTYPYFIDNDLRYYYGGSQGTETALINNWHKLEIRNFDWTAHTYDIVLGDVVVYAGVNMHPYTGNNDLITVFSENYIGFVDNIYIRKYNDPEPAFASAGAEESYAGSIHYNTTTPYNHTIESDGTITSNRTMIAADNINWTASAVSDDCQMVVTEYNLANNTIANFTLYNASLDWVKVTNLTVGAAYRLTNDTDYEEQIADASGEVNFTTDLIPGDYWILYICPGFSPPNPTNLANTTGNFWVNHTWEAGSGNVTDSYNVSVNSIWYNTTIDTFYNDTYTAHAWQNITVWAYNASGAGTLSASSISQDTQIPNNPVTITNTSDWTGNIGENVSVDYDGIDIDDDTLIFSCDRIDLFTDFNISDGTGIWNYTGGTIYVDFGVSDGWGSIDNYTMTISDATPPPPTVLDEIKSCFDELLSGLSGVYDNMGIYIIYGLIMSCIFLIFTFYSIIVKMVKGST